MNYYGRPAALQDFAAQRDVFAAVIDVQRRRVLADRGHEQPARTRDRLSAVISEFYALDAALLADNIKYFFWNIIHINGKPADL